jgi:hypothetical protein
MQYDDSYTDGGRITFSSILLLVIFVSAAALIVAAIIWRPWFGDSDSTAGLSAPAAEQVDDSEVALEDNAITAESNADEVEADPIVAQ